MPVPNWKQRKVWNTQVHPKVAEIKKLMNWCARWESWGSKNNDWYTERGFGRVLDYLSLAQRELRDMQYFTDQDARGKWKASVDID